MNSKRTKTADHTIILTISIPSTELKTTKEEVTDEMAKTLTIAGFRKGKAPKKLVLEKLDKDKITEEALKKILPRAYADAVKEHNLSPIVNPRIHIEELKDDTDVIFTAQTCEEPEVDLKNYKEELTKLNAKSKIIIPGKEKDGNKKPSLEEITTTLLTHTNVTVPKILTEQEVERLLSQFLDELKTLGLTLEQYLSSRNKTGEQLRREYEEKAENDIKLEFLLRRIANVENITVEEADIEQVISKVQDQNQKKSMEENKYLLSALIRQQKTLDFLSKI